MVLGVSALNKDDGLKKQPHAASPQIPTDAKRRRSDETARKSEPQIGRALRSVYDQTVGEAIPSEMLDLLGRLD